MIVGVGVDVVDLERFAARVEGTPGLLERLFAPEEREHPVVSLAGRFAAKEALAKSLGAPGGLHWVDAVVRTCESGEPYWVLTGSVRDRADELGVATVHLSISHDGPVATAFVVAEA